MTFGRNTRVKLLGGELVFNEAGESFEQWSESLEGLRYRSAHLGPAFAAFQPLWFAAIAELFAEEGASENWPELSPAYKKWKNSHGGGTMMRLSDRLYDSLTSVTHDTIWRTTHRTIQFGTRVPYFFAHQEGVGVPMRRTLVMTPTVFSELHTVVINYLKSGDHR
jgi:phage gpG-like protein